MVSPNIIVISTWHLIVRHINTLLKSQNFSIIIGAYAFKREWKKGPSKSSKPIWFRIAILSLCGALYLSM